MHGKGIYYYPDGKKYIGEWKNNKKHGKGTMIYSNGNKKVGYWQNDKYAGKKKPSGKPKIWAVIVGVAKYNHMNSLDFADDDAQEIAAHFRSPEGGAVHHRQIKKLIDENATKNNILKACRNTFSIAGTNDVIIFYFSGHGSKKGLYPYDYKDSLSQLVSHNEISKYIKDSSAKQKIVIIDACFSGAFKEKNHDNIAKELNKLYKKIDNSTKGTLRITSSKSTETSIETDGKRQGVFSYYFIKGLRGEANSNDDNIITIEEIFNYVKKMVKKRTNNKQTPTIDGYYDKNMPLGIVRD